MTDNSSQKRPLFTVITVLLVVVILQAIFLIYYFSGPSKKQISLSGGNSEILRLPHTGNLIKGTYPHVDFTKVYPDLPEEEIDQLQRESFDLRYIFWPHVTTRPLPFSGRYIKVHPAGFREAASEQPWPPLKKDLVVFVFGGSTTFCYGLPTGQTLPEALQKELSRIYKDRNVQCYNFGRGYYFLTQERILFESLLQEGIVPDIAIFIDGLNDFGYYHDWPEYSDNLFRFTAPDIPLDGPAWHLNDEGKVRLVIDRFENNFRMAGAAAKEYGVAAVFVGQPTPFLDFNRNKETYPFIKTFGGNELAKAGYGPFKQAAAEGRFGKNFIWCGDAFLEAKTSVYADSIHYSHEGVKMLSKVIVQRSLEKGLLPEIDQKKSDT